MCLYYLLGVVFFKTILLCDMLLEVNKLKYGRDGAVEWCDEK